MRTTELGRTGLSLSTLGFGAMHLSLAGHPPDEKGIEVIHRALDRGITLIDTADSYCETESDKHANEKLIHHALAEYEGDIQALVVATKGGMKRPDGRWVAHGDPDHLRRTLRESAEILGQPITLWQHHTPDPDFPVSVSLKAAREAVDEGLVRYVGVSNYSVEQIKQAQDVVEVVSVQNEYSPLHRSPEQNGVLDYCEKEGLTFLAYRPLGGKRRSKSFGAYPDLVELSQEKGVSPQRLVLAWLMARYSCVVPIPGASRTESIEDSAGAVEVVLNEEEIDRIGSAVR